jgi:hypothetical protein
MSIVAQSPADLSPFQIFPDLCYNKDFLILVEILSKSLTFFKCLCEIVKSIIFNSKYNRSNKMALGKS